MIRDSFYDEMEKIASRAKRITRIGKSPTIKRWAQKWFLGGLDPLVQKKISLLGRGSEGICHKVLDTKGNVVVRKIYFRRILRDPKKREFLMRKHELYNEAADYVNKGMGYKVIPRIHHWDSQRGIAYMDHFNIAKKQPTTKVFQGLFAPEMKVTKITSKDKQKFVKVLNGLKKEKGVKLHDSFVSDFLGFDLHGHPENVVYGAAGKLHILDPMPSTSTAKAVKYINGVRINRILRPAFQEQMAFSAKIPYPVTGLAGVGIVGGSTMAARKRIKKRRLQNKKQ